MKIRKLKVFYFLKNYTEQNKYQHKNKSLKATDAFQIKNLVGVEWKNLCLSSK